MVDLTNCRLDQMGSRTSPRVDKENKIAARPAGVAEGQHMRHVLDLHFVAPWIVAKERNDGNHRLLRWSVDSTFPIADTAPRNTCNFCDLVLLKAKN